MSASKSFTVTPIEKCSSSKTDFGVVIADLDLNNISDEDVQALSDAIWTHKLVVVKGQKSLAPIKQWDLVRRFDPAAEEVHSHGDIKALNKPNNMLSRGGQVYAIPGAENIRIVGKGFLGEDHYGLKNLTVNRKPLHSFHAEELAPDEFDRGHTRFQRWHIDAPLYERDPAWFTTLRCVKRPVTQPGLPPLTVHWDDGSGQTMATEPGLTAFFSNVQAYQLMSEAERRMVDHSWVEYAPHPYTWMSNCKGRANGLGLETQGRERALADLDAFDPAKVKTYPMVWLNPVTGERAFMVHGLAARRLFLRSSPEEEPRVVDDVAAIRAFLHPLQERVLRPEFILIPTVEEGDILMWANYQMFHSAIDYPDAFGPRSMHQANIGASKGPLGPVPLPIQVSA
ncbi:alpha-ketoglutarate dependent xanthine dioxygenase [Grosmannia clavigera kw1407]|uniref:Alpha-ketoglutarate dependent xanthine dioxygenase n=1 Tax=Grosmannia clavigera (strain kw1407 / UAMH 11150) TaxID=655863 RepID=F0XDT5_GROCL|nr:alpha-ketoglutarate dependent xanthine dioxygenase [Grosmannia clavigera kw1407]EFX04570.1 alpha-ketoglutarate dependent xanthine dioxygenase [Grosmannia clavigera kw1407]